MPEYHSNEEYFRDHPEEEAAFYDDMAELYGDHIPDYPEDWDLGPLGGEIDTEEVFA